MQPGRDQVALFRRLFLVHRPTNQAWMQEPGAIAKYRKRFHAVSNDEIAAHLAGTLTLAAPLIGWNGQANATALDIDAGGEPAIRQVLAITASAGYTAFGTVSVGSTDGHNGGHVWLLFDDLVEPQGLRQLATQLAAAADVPAETYPTRKALRLPLGVHRWTGRRGCLLLPDGSVHHLDISYHAVTAALQALAALPRNPVARLPQVAPTGGPTSRSSTGGRTHVAPGAGTRATIAAYNQVTDLIGVLEAYGGRIATVYPGGGGLLHCPCNGHAHGDQHPSLEVHPATNSRYGRSVAYGYAPACMFSTEAGQVIDAFGVYCRLEHLSPAEAITRLGRRDGSVRTSSSGRASQAHTAGDQPPLVEEVQR